MKLRDANFDKRKFIKSLESIGYLFLVLPLVAFGWVFLEKESTGGLRNTFFENTDIIMEISTEFNKKLMWMLRKKKNLKIYSQKNGWDQIKRIEDLPNTHREGSIFISHKNKFLK